jgi:G3E family GTPase
MKQVPMHFITGFLGSGKTTLINSLLKSAGTKKIGLLLNDFGSICIDDTLTDFNNGITQIGLSGGQIFCACLSGSFVKSILSFRDLDLDCILIEASGLAKPNTLFDIVSAIEKQSDRYFIYGSTSCVIDALSFEKLLQSVNAIKEQALTADKFFITKLDDKTDLDKNRIQCILEEINPTASIEVVIDKSINWDGFETYALEEKLKGKAKLSYKTWGDFNRPVTGTAKFTKVLSFKDLKLFLNEISKDVLRAKGFVKTSDRGILFCEIASTCVIFKESNKVMSLNTIVLIKKHDVELKFSNLNGIVINWD